MNWNFFFLIDVGNSPSNAKTTKTCSYKLQRDYVKTHFKQVWQKGFDRKRGAALGSSFITIENFVTNLFKSCKDLF
jgi:hypothetical protein